MAKYGVLEFEGLRFELPDSRYDVPGFEGSLGPFKGQYDKPHVYARDIYSGSGNCVCGQALGCKLHTEAAPGIPIPEEFRY